MIKAVQPATKWKLLVVDGRSAKLLNTICKTHEILEENVTGIDSLTKLLKTCHRNGSLSQTTKQSTLSPHLLTVSIESSLISRMINSYTLLLIYFSFPVTPNLPSALDDILFDKIKKSGAIKHIKTLKEMNIDFIGIQKDLI